MCRTLDKIAFCGLTAVITYQIYYNYRAVTEMGHGYLSVLSLLYNIGALIPALFLGLHCIKAVFAEDKQTVLKAKGARKYKVFSWAYLSLIAVMFIFKVYLRFEYVHQLAPERITSFDKAMTYQMYYYVVI